VELVKIGKKTRSTFSIRRLCVALSALPDSRSLNTVLTCLEAIIFGNRLEISIEILRRYL
jgi:hypothetical protein